MTKRHESWWKRLTGEQHYSRLGQASSVLSLALHDRMAFLGSLIEPGYYRGLQRPLATGQSGDGQPALSKSIFTKVQERGNRVDVWTVGIPGSYR